MNSSQQPPPRSPETTSSSGLTRSTSSGAGFVTNGTASNGYAAIEEAVSNHNKTSIAASVAASTASSSSTGLVKSRTMSYQQKAFENGEEELRKTSLASRPNIKELTNKQKNWFSSFEKSRNLANTAG
jgi:hypothetical protein